jgi:hypothetical protein
MCVGQALTPDVDVGCCLIHKVCQFQGDTGGEGASDGHGAHTIRRGCHRPRGRLLGAGKERQARRVWEGDLATDLPCPPHT